MRPVAAVAQLAERVICNLEVTGSIPVGGFLVASVSTELSCLRRRALPVLPNTKNSETPHMLQNDDNPTPSSDTPHEGADQQPAESDAAASTSTENGASDAEQGSDAGAGTSPDPEQTAAEVGESIATGLDSVGDRVAEVIEEPTLDNAINVLGPLLIDAGLALAGFIVLVIVVSFIGRGVRRVTAAGLRRLDLEKTVVNFLSRVAGISVWVLALPVALEIFGIKTASFAAVIGAAGLAIGLAMQGALSNIAAGIMLLVLRPFKIGDWVELDDEFGIIQDVGIFYTEIETFSHKLVLLPNGEVLGAKIEHYTANKTRRVDVPVGVAYGTDLKKAMDILKRAADEVSASERKNDQPSVILTGFNDSSIDFEVRVWSPTREYLDTQTRAILAINEALSDAEIEIPFPQRTLTFADPLNIEGAPSGGGDR